MPVAVDVWEGLVWVCVGEPALPLAVTLDGIAERIAPQDLTGVRFHSRVEYAVAKFKDRIKAVDVTVVAPAPA